jgi:hypothetical protein
MSGKGDTILDIFDKNKFILKDKAIETILNKPRNEYKKNKILEINEIYDIEYDTAEIIKKLEERYKTELKGFTYLEDLIQLEDDKKYFIRYIGINGKFNYGGFLYYFPNDYCIRLINNSKKAWDVIVNENFIWFSKVLNENDKKRAQFDAYLKVIENK